MIKSIFKRPRVSLALAAASVLLAGSIARAGNLQYTTSGAFNSTGKSSVDLALVGGSAFSAGTATLTFDGTTSSSTGSNVTLGTFTLTDDITAGAAALTSDKFTLKVVEGSGTGSATSTLLTGIVVEGAGLFKIDFDGPDNPIFITGTTDSYAVNDVTFNTGVPGSNVLTGTVTASNSNDLGSSTPLPAPATAGMGLFAVLAGGTGLRKLKLKQLA